MTNEEKTREERTKQLLLDQAKRAIELRSKEREFHGLEREFLYEQSQMLVDYAKSKDVKHPRDLGDVREQILSRYLTQSGYLPKRYAVSERRTRVVSPTGHMSAEMDIALYDLVDSIRLMCREGVYEVLPVESVYGVIQVKSRLNKAEIRVGLENIASFKRLKRPCEIEPRRLSLGKSAGHGFGILFAYETDLEWVEVIREIEAFAKQHPSREWCNAVFILSQGFMLHGNEGTGKYENGEIEKIGTLQMHGFPDRQGQCLYRFHELLLTLLHNTGILPADFTSYFRLPLVSGEESYEFCLGAFAEVATCEIHGDYQRKIGHEQLGTLIACCRKVAPINWIQALDIARGEPGDRQEQYARQPGDVRIYNPEGLPLKDILIGEHGQLSFDQIRCADMTIFVPYYYSKKEGIIFGCPKCARNDLA